MRRIALLTLAVATVVVAVAASSPAPAATERHVTADARTLAVQAPADSIEISERAPQVPLSPTTLPLSFAFAGMTAARKRSAKKGAADTDPNLNPDDPSNQPLKAKAARKVPMFVDSEVHLPAKTEGKPHRVIKGGVLLDELEVELDDDEVDELIALKAIRPATPAEIAAADKRAEQEEE